MTILFAGHLGCWKAFVRVRKSFQVSKLNVFLNWYNTIRAICQRFNYKNKVPVGFFPPINDDPNQAISDNGNQFVSDIFKELCHHLGVQHLKAILLPLEKQRRWTCKPRLIQMIVSFVSNFHRSRDKHIQKFAYMLKTTVHNSTGNISAELFLPSDSLSWRFLLEFKRYLRFE